MTSACSSWGRTPAPLVPAGRTVGLYHLAWEVQTLTDLEDLAARLEEAGALVGASDHGTTKSLYGKDPDGLEFEIAWVIPAALLDETALAGRTSIGRLDLAAEKARYGADTRGRSRHLHPVNRQQARRPVRTGRGWRPAPHCPRWEAPRGTTQTVL